VNLAFPILLSWPVARVVSSSCRYAAVFDLFEHASDERSM
jgi:hypothetical protein